MDPVTLIVTALVAGAAAGAGDAAKSAISDAYTAFKSMIKTRFSGNTAAEVALEKHEKSPEAWAPALKEEIVVAKLDKDDAVLAAARSLIEDAKAAGVQVGVSQSAHGTQIVQVNDAHGVTVTIGASPSSSTGS